MSSREEIRRFILAHTALQALGDEEDVFDSGAVSSMFLMQLVLFVESRFGLTLMGEDLRFENFRSVAAIDRLASRGVSGPTAA